MLLTVGRKAGEGVISYEEALQKHTDATVILNTTPCGMYPYPDGAPGLAGTPVDLSAFPNLAGVMDAVYNPLRTNLVLDAAARGIPAEGGLYMLVAQAVLASRLFVGQAASAADIDPDTDALCAQTYSRVRADKENVVLIGMPGSGKTTVGRALAEAMGRPFYDTDEELVKRTERDISAIFAQDGEAAFRDLETETIRSLTATVTGAVIATGGGAVLREENLRALRRNGRLYFLDRALQHLLPTSDRPLASSADAIRARYEERYALYCAACDCRVAVDEVPAHTVNTVRKDFYDER
jgi:shikimate dehydrogenase